MTAEKIVVKRKQPTLKVTVTYKETSDAAERLRRCLEILLHRPKVGEEDAKRREPPTGSDHAGS